MESLKTIKEYCDHSHKDSVIGFCNSCKKIICEDCSSNFHFEHVEKIQYYEDLFNSGILESKTQLRRLEIKRKGLRTQIKNVNLDEIKTKIERYIEYSYEKLTNFILHHKKQTLSKYLNNNSMFNQIKEEIDKFEKWEEEIQLLCTTISEKIAKLEKTLSEKKFVSELELIDGTVHKNLQVKIDTTLEMKNTISPLTEELENIKISLNLKNIDCILKVENAVIPETPLETFNRFQNELDGWSVGTSATDSLILIPQKSVVIKGFGAYLPWNWKKAEISIKYWIKLDEELMVEKTEKIQKTKSHIAAIYFANPIEVENGKQFIISQSYLEENETEIFSGSGQQAHHIFEVKKSPLDNNSTNESRGLFPQIYYQQT